MARHRLLQWLAAVLLAPGLCAAADERPPDTFELDPRSGWIDTGLDVSVGDPIHIEASGSYRPFRRPFTKWFLDGPPADRWIGPEGTYVWPVWYAQRAGAFPMAAMAQGPHPAFALIGRIGAGEPFHVGARYDGAAFGAGRLWLGVNDDRPADNRGHLRAVVSLRAAPAPVPPPARVIDASAQGAPVAGARVVLLYIDGLRPDVLRGMAEAGYLPNFKRTFFDGGAWVEHAFTGFPSNTLIANGSLFTGRFSDRTGIKSQNQFERTTLKPRGQISAWLPDGFIARPTTRIFNLLDKYAPENTHDFLLRRKVPTVGSRLGHQFVFTTLPIAPLNPPPLWFRRAVNTLGPANLTTRLPHQIDEVNVRYAAEVLFGGTDARVIAVWLPMVDKTSHHSARGQFGAARRDLVLADRWLGLLLGRLRELGWDRSTYLVLVSDHGHIGGDVTVNQTCNLPQEWAHRQLGLNAKVVGDEWTHAGIDPKRFVFFDNQGAGQTKLFLPKGDYFTGPWERNRLADLTRYRLRSSQSPINLLESLAGFHPPGWNGQGNKPIDLVLVKLDASRFLIYRDAGRQAIVSREGDGPETRYRYRPVRGLTQSDDGELRYDPVAPEVDPLGYMLDPAFLESGGVGWLAEPHTAREWLMATYRTRYPDAVVAMSKFFAWQQPVEDLADVRDPDLIVTAAPGWTLRSDGGTGTDHGHPLAEAMRITLAFAGPNIRHGVLREPRRIVDVLPTILDMVGRPADPASVDGEPIRGMYE